MTAMTVYGLPEQTYILPDYARLLTWRENPQYDKCTVDLKAWIAQFSEAASWAGAVYQKAPQTALTDFLDQGVGPRFTCLAFPLTTDDRIRALSDLMMWFTTLDDTVTLPGPFQQADEATRKHAFTRIYEILEGSGRIHQPGTEPDPIDQLCLSRLLDDIWYRICLTCPAGVKDRTVEAVSNVFAEWDQIASTIAVQGGIPLMELEAYMEFRRTDVSALFLPRFIELGLGIDVGEEVSHHPQIQKMEELQRTQLVLQNDLYSFRKEWARNQDTQNVIAIFCLGHGMTLQEAINRTCRLMEEAEQEFVTLRDTFLSAHPEISQDVRTFLDGLGYLVAGTLQFQRCTPRYHGDGRRYCDVGSGLVTLDDTYTIVTPLRATRTTGRTASTGAGG